MLAAVFLDKKVDSAVSNHVVTKKQPLAVKLSRCDYQKFKVSSDLTRKRRRIRGSETFVLQYR